MTGFLLRRAANYVVLLEVLASFLTFALASLTFHPLDSLEQRSPRPPQSVIDAKAAELHLNEPILPRYGTWVTGVVLHGDFGKTLAGQPVTQELGRRIGVSLRLLVIGSVVGTVLGVLIGAAGAIRQYRFSDYFTTIVSMLLLSTPIFLLATLLKYGALQIDLAAGQQIFLYTGETSAAAVNGLWNQIVDRAQHMVLPTLGLALGSMAGYSRSVPGAACGPSCEAPRSRPRSRPAGSAVPSRTAGPAPSATAISAPAAPRPAPARRCGSA